MKLSITIFILLSLFIIIITSCSDNSTDVLGDVTFESYQVGGCNGNTLAKASYLDSCFSYNFDDNLAIDFCLYGNCCPDTNRFITDFTIIADTIYITAKDIAPKLCRCSCSYQIHVEFTNLEYVTYIIRCDYDSVFSYREVVTRSL